MPRIIKKCVQDSGYISVDSGFFFYYIYVAKFTKYILFYVYTIFSLKFLDKIILIR